MGGQNPARSASAVSGSGLSLLTPRWEKGGSHKPSSPGARLGSSGAGPGSVLSRGSRVGTEPQHCCQQGSVHSNPTQTSNFPEHGDSLLKPVTNSGTSDTVGRTPGKSIWVFWLLWPVLGGHRVIPGSSQILGDTTPAADLPQLY